MEDDQHDKHEREQTIGVQNREEAESKEWEEMSSSSTSSSGSIPFPSRIQNEALKNKQNISLLTVLLRDFSLSTSSVLPSFQHIKKSKN